MYLTSDGLRNLQVHFCNFNVFSEINLEKLQWKFEFVSFIENLIQLSFEKWMNVFQTQRIIQEAVKI